MKKVKTSCLLFCFFVFLSSTAQSEIYKYRDTHGNLIFTDNLSEVPANQRNKVKQYKEIKSPPVDLEGAEEAGDIPETDDEEPLPEEGEMESPGLNPQEKSVLIEEGESLNEEYEQLLEEKKTLEERKDVMEPGPHNDLVRGYNKKIKEYEARQKVYNEEVDAYNKSLLKPETPD